VIHLFQGLIMLLASHLRRSRHGIFYFRIVLPAPIAAVLGQRELVRSLGIRSPKLARQSGYQLSLQITPILERLQRIMAIDPNSINPNDVRKLVVEGLVFASDGSMRAERVKTSDDPGVAQREMKALSDTATAWRQVHDFTKGMDDETFALRDAEAMRLRDELLAMAAAAQPSAVLASAPASTSPAAAQGVIIPVRPETLAKTFADYMKTKANIAPATITAYKGSFELFATLVGGAHRMAHEITKVELLEFNDALSHIPTHAKKRGIKLGTAAEILKNPPVKLDKNGQPIDYDIISGDNANLHLTNLQGLFDYVISSGRREGENTFKTMTRHSDGNQGGGAVGFEENELRAIFDPESLMKAKRPSQFWGPLLALYTGARLNELACLDLVDFVEEKGIPCISVRFVPRAKPRTKPQKQSKKQEAAARTAKQVKTVTSRRQVPLHPDLWEIGLQEYIDDVRSIGATRLFPTMPLDKKGKRERRMSHDGNEYLKMVGVHINRQKVMHAFRDTVSDMLGISDMDEFSADQWTGHTTQGIKAKHYRKKVAIDIQAVKGFKALDFPFINTELIQYRPGWFNAYNKEYMVP
jgi:integrase